MSYKIEPLPDGQVELGEGPHWDIASKSLYFVDIRKALLLRYDYKQSKVYRAKIEKVNSVGFVIPVENNVNKFVAGTDRSISIVHWDGIAETCKVEKVLAQLEEGDEKFEFNRLNDGKCDPCGRLIAGSMRDFGDILEFRYGSLYCLSKDRLETLKGNIGISNGLTWNEKSKKFYYIDSADFNVKEYDYNCKTGNLGNEKVLIDFNALEGRPRLFPDGMTIDSEGFLYIATFNGGAIFKVNPSNGNIELEIKLPCEKITSVAFGGPNLDILYATSAALGDKNSVAGTTFQITGLGVRGLPMTNFKN